MKIIRKGSFSMMEVLLAIALIAIAMPILIAPFTATAKDSQAAYEKMRIEKAAQFAAANFMIDLHLGKIPLTAVENEEIKPVPEEWFKEINLENVVHGEYKIVRHGTKPKKEEDKKVGLWNVLFTLKTPLETYSFTYLFGIQKGNET